jgi:hypothetical protein
MFKCASDSKVNEIPQVSVIICCRRIAIETVEKPIPKRLMENVQMQGFRNPEE